MWIALRRVASGSVRLSPRLATVSLVVIGLALRLGFLWNGGLDSDESQHLHAAWLVAQREIPYVDFWENHSPLFYYLAAPLTRRFVDSPSVYFTARAVMLVIAVVALWLLFLIVRRLSLVVAFVTVTLLCLQPRLIQYTTQVRPDVPALCTWLAALLALVRWRETGAPRWMWSTGLLLGVTAAFSPKAIYEFAGVAVFVVIIEVQRGGFLLRTLTMLVRLCTGAAVPMLVLSGWIWATGGGRAIGAFLQSVVIDNLHYSDAAKRMPVGLEGAVLILLASGGMVMIVQRLRLGAVAHSVHGPLLVPAVVIFIILLLPTTPAVYEYTWLPVAMSAAVYAAIGTRAVIRSGRRPVGVVVIVVVAVGAFVLPAAMAAVVVLRDENKAVLSAMRRELAYACPNDAVFDGTGLYVFRPSATHYGALVKGIRRAIREGTIPVTVVIDELRQSRAPVGFWDARLRIIGGPIADFATRYYVRQPDGVLLAGSTITPADVGADGHASVDLLRNSLYHVNAPAGSDLQIDGLAVSPGLRRLTAGRHVVTGSALRGPIDITASTCAERIAAGGTD